MPVTTALGSNADLAEEVIESGACPLWHIADIVIALSDVCFRGNSGHFNVR